MELLLPLHLLCCYFSLHDSFFSCTILSSGKGLFSSLASDRLLLPSYDDIGDCNRSSSLPFSIKWFLGGHNLSFCKCRGIDCSCWSSSSATEATDWLSRISQTIFILLYSCKHLSCSAFQLGLGLRDDCFDGVSYEAGIKKPKTLKCRKVVRVGGDELMSFDYRFDYADIRVWIGWNVEKVFWLIEWRKSLPQVSLFRYANEKFSNQYMATVWDLSKPAKFGCSSTTANGCMLTLKAI
ncbi:unnamed protein product [Lactuca saligna]|uniref:Uncharacterized protein n=1 Tax=Lactuca saligna TaxID=75948 RepID=A0AA36EHI2_LACSI|nr:unnamed protein product [Lactuca saligna]